MMRALPWLAVGEDAGLRAGQRHGGHAQVEQRHRQHRDRDLLAGREQHVDLTQVRGAGDLRGEAEQLVGRVAHRGDDDAHRGSVAGGCRDARGDAPDSLGRRE